MATLQKQLVRMARGEDKILRFTNTDFGSISAWTLTFELWKDRRKILVTKTVGSGITITTAGSATTYGVAEVTLAAANMATFAQGAYQGWLRRTNSGNARRVALIELLLEDEEAL